MGFMVDAVSTLTGKKNYMEFPDELKERIVKFATDMSDRRPIQEIFPELTADQREFLLTGITPEEWEQATNPEGIANA